MSIKVTNEAPVGLRAGLRASYQWVTQDTLDAVARPEWRPLLFALCFLHSVVQERRKFGPIGWNVPYEFNASDLSACAQFLQVGGEVEICTWRQRHRALGSGRNVSRT